MVHPPTSRVRVKVFAARRAGAADDPEGAGGRSGGGARERTIARTVCDGSFVAGARIIKADGRTSVFSADAAGYPVVVKTLALDRLKDRLGSRLRRTRLWRQVRGAQRVEGCGVRVAPVIAIARGLDSSDHRVEALVLERVEGPTLLRAASERTLSPRSARLLLDRIGADVGSMARAGVCNRDHKPSNLIVATDEAGEVAPVLIDTADIRTRSQREAVEAMLSKLLLEPLGTGIEITAREQVRVARAALTRSGSDRALRDLLEAVRDRIERHGDPTPKDDPLGFDS